MPEYVDRYAAPRIPISADAEKVRRNEVHDPLADADRAFLVESAVVAKAREVELERFRLEEPIARQVIDD